MRGSRPVQQRQQTALAVERHEVITTADMGLANENLWNSAPTGNFHHFDPLLGLTVNTNFFNVIDAPGLQNAFGLYAIGANRRGVHLHNLHGVNLVQPAN